MKPLGLLPFVVLSGCVFSASLDEIPEGSTTDNNVVNNNLPDLSILDDLGVPDLGTPDMDEPACDLLTQLEGKSVPFINRNKVYGAVRADSRGDTMIVAVDYDTEYRFYRVGAAGARSVAVDNVPKPDENPQASSFDVALVSAEPARWMLVESRGAGADGVLAVTMCGGDAMTCASQTTTQAADSLVRARFYEEGNTPAVMIGYSNDPDGLGVQTREYHSRIATLDSGVPTLLAGYINLSSPTRNILGVDFAHVDNKTFRTVYAAGISGDFVSTTNGGTETTCDFKATLIPKSRTAQGSPNALYLTSNHGLYHAPVECGAGSVLADRSKTVTDFDMVASPSGDFASWVEVDGELHTVRGEILRDGSRQSLTFDAEINGYDYVRVGRVGNEVVLILAGVDGVDMIRGTTEQLVACYGN